MNQNEQLTRHEREIGELRGKLDSLATKDFVREVVYTAIQEQTRIMNAKFDEISRELRKLNAKQHRIIGAADIIKTALPLLISVVTLLILIISLLAQAG